MFRARHRRVRLVRSVPAPRGRRPQTAGPQLALFTCDSPVDPWGLNAVHLLRIGSCWGHPLPGVLASRLESTMCEQMLTRSSKAPVSTTPEMGLCEVRVVDEGRVVRARRALLAKPVLEVVTDAFKVLSHPTRVHLLQALSAGELCVCELAEVVGLSVSATSHQLRDLRRLRLVAYRMDGRLAFYSIRDPFVLGLLDAAVDHYDEGLAS
jgi:DNA-binding transcriptional ArsR family regulator